VMRDFLARLFGHALLGKLVEHVLAILYGIGANGKTTLVEALLPSVRRLRPPGRPRPAH
jgi:putative DNA primase/helicase